VDMYKDPVPQSVKLLLGAQTIMDTLGEYIKTNGKSSLPPRKELILRATVESSIRRQGTAEKNLDRKET